MAGEAGSECRRHVAAVTRGLCASRRCCCASDVHGASRRADQLPVRHACLGGTRTLPHLACRMWHPSARRPRPWRRTRRAPSSRARTLRARRASSLSAASEAGGTDKDLLLVVQGSRYACGGGGGFVGRRKTRAPHLVGALRACPRDHPSFRVSRDRYRAGARRRCRRLPPASHLLHALARRVDAQLRRHGPRHGRALHCEERVLAGQL